MVASALLGVFCSTFFSAATFAQKPNVEGKVVLANLDRYDTVVKFGSNRRTIKPRKASILTPKSYPVTIEYWSGNTKNNWQKATISKAGIYGFNFKQGNWVLVAVNPKPKAPVAGTAPTSPPIQRTPSAATQPGAQRTNAAPRPANNVLRQRVIQQPPMRYGINADRGRWSPLARVAWAAGSIYSFVRDEQDRDLIRDAIIRGRAEDIRDLNRWIDDAEKIAVPYKQELKDAMRELDQLSDADWNSLETVDQRSWDQAKNELGQLMPAEQWDKFSNDFADINTNEFWREDKSNIDLNDLDVADNLDESGNFDIGDEMDFSENLDVGDFGIDQTSFDLEQFDDFNAYDGVAGVEASDLLGGDLGGDFGGDDIGASDFGGGGDFGDDDMGDFGGGDDFDF